MNEIYFVGNPQLIETNLYKVATMDDVVGWLKDKDEICLDSETEGFFNHKNKMIMLQLYSEVDKKAYVIDTRTVDIKALKRLEEILVIGQNLKFDYKFLKFHGIELNYIYDTFLAECCLTNGIEGRELGLGALVKKYCNAYIDKSIRNQFIGLNGQPFTESQIVYGVNDIIYLPEIREKQKLEIDRLELNGWVNNENNVCLAIADIEYNGLGFDENKWLEIANSNEKKIPQHIEELDQMLIDEPKLIKFVKTHIQTSLFEEVVDRKVLIEWSSPIQVLKLINALGINIESSSEKEIQQYQDQYPIIKKFIDYKKDAKLVSTYGKTFLKYINPVTKRIHTSFWQILDTSRVSSGDKVSPNLKLWVFI